MEKMLIGTSNVYAPVLTLGSFGMGGGTSWQDTTKDDQELVDFIRAAHKIGVCGIDTAPVYGTGRSEKIVGRAIKEDRSGWYLSTKCGMNWRNEKGKYQYTRDGNSVYFCCDRDSIIRDVEDSLNRLDTDYIDLMIVHRTPELNEIPAVMETLQELKDRKLIRAAGISNTALVDYTMQALAKCVENGELDLVQEHASLLYRQNLGELLKFCEENHITFQDYSGLEKGALAGKLIEGISGMTGDNRSKYKWFQPDGIKKLNAMTTALLPMAEKYNCTVPVLCLAWLRQQSANINLLVGARKIDSVQDTLNVLNVKISQEDIDYMSELSDLANS